MKHHGGRLPDAKNGVNHLSTWHAAQEGLLLAGSSEPGHHGEKAEDGSTTVLPCGHQKYVQERLEVYQPGLHGFE